MAGKQRRGKTKFRHVSWRDCILPLIVIAVFLVMWALVYAPWSNPAAPAWVQAIGSVAAIFTAVGISYWQYRETKQETIRDALKYMERVHFDTAFASGYLDGITFDMQDGKIPRDRLPRAIRLAKAIYEDLRSYDHLLIEDARYARRWQGYVRTVRHFIEEIEQDLSDESGGGSSAAARHLDILKSESEKLRTDFNEYMDKKRRRDWI